jgi:hypothetical protein
MTAQRYVAPPDVGRRDDSGSICSTDCILGKARVSREKTNDTSNLCSKRQAALVQCTREPSTSETVRGTAAADGGAG